MADELKMDPARIARLRDPKRLETIDPLRILEAATPVGEGPVVDVGCGVGFATLPLARRLPDREVVGVDLLAGMVELLAADAAAAGLANLKTHAMPGPAAIPLDAGSASLVCMVQVHHELDDAPALMRECRRVLAPGAAIVVVDWKPDDDAKGRRLPPERIEADLSGAGFADVRRHDLYPLHSVISGRAPASG
jgi:SAM-dependent methyltransferase